MVIKEVGGDDMSEYIKRKVVRRVYECYMRVCTKAWEKVFGWVEWRLASWKIRKDLYDHKGMSRRSEGISSNDVDPIVQYGAIPEVTEDYRVCPECGCEYYSEHMVCSSCSFLLS